MDNYVLVAISISIFIAISEILIVNGKNGKLVKIILSLLCVTAFIEPILSLFNENYDSDESNFNADYTNYLLKIEEKTLENEIENVIKKQNSDLKSVNVTLDSLDGVISTKKVEIIFYNQGINCDSDHINITTETKALLYDTVLKKEKEVEIVIEFENTS